MSKTFKLYNESAHLLTFTAHRNAGAVNPEGLPLKSRISIIPGKFVEMDKDSLDILFTTDKVAMHYWTERVLECSGYEPPSGDEEIERVRKMAAHHRNQHARLPSSMRSKQEAPPEEKPERAKTIEPTPNAGVPGNADQAKKAVAKSMDVIQIDSWLKTETRKSVKAALNARKAELENPTALVEDDGDDA